MKQVLTRLTQGKTLGQGILLLGLTLLFSFGVFVTPATATTVYDLPNVSAGDSTWVVDDADVLSRINEGKLGKTLDKVAQDTGNEVRLVTVYRLNYGDTIETFADELFEAWFPTPEAAANQVLLVLDTLTNSSAIRVGSEVNLSDEVATSIAQENLLIPVQKEKKYNKGVLSASDRIAAVLSGQEDPGPPQEANLNIEATFTDAEETDDQNATVWVIGFLVFATIIPMVTYYAYVGFPGR